MFLSIANLKCTPSGKQMYPRLGNTVLESNRSDEFQKSIFAFKIFKKNANV